MGAARKIFVADLFCGAGGASYGLARACETMRLDVDLLAINHWNIAIQSHWANFPWARHLCQNLDAVDPTKAVPRGLLDILIAAPECTHHSTARGGRPVEDQLRASPWHVCRWAERLHIESILVENVPEFRKWGPLIPKLDDRGRPVIHPKTGQVVMVPDPDRRGETFEAFIQALRSLGYTVEYRILNAADFGDATTRRRLFIMCRKGKKAIRWPTPTHAKDGAGGLKTYRAIRECIDWSNLGESIFNRPDDPLALSTLARIDAGLQKFCGFEPFLVKLYGTGKAADINQPCPTITATGQHLALVNPVPMIVNMKGQSDVSSIDQPGPTQTTRFHQYLAQTFILGHRQFGQDIVDSVDDPARTITGKSSDIKAAFIVGLEHAGANGKQVRSVEEPAPTVTAHPRLGVVNLKPFMIPFYGERKGQLPRVHSVDDPSPAVTSHGAGAIIDPKPFLVDVNHGGQESGRVHSVEEPLKTATSKNGKGLVQPMNFLIRFNGNHKGKEDGAQRVYSVDDPLGTQDTQNRYALVTGTPFLVKYYGTAKTQPVDDPIGTLTTKPRFALCVPVGDGKQGILIDILLRMLSTRELGRAMSFPENYKFSGSKADQVKQIGNAWPCELSRALCSTLLAHVRKRRFHLS